MNLSSGLLEAAVKEFSKLPGIGKKTALRLVLHLLKQEKSDVQAFSETIERMRDEIQFCSTCFNISDEDTCTICKSPRRDRSIVCVVEDMRDVMAIENTAQFQGLYHVLGGVISPVNGIGPGDLRIESLLNRVGISGSEIREVILALSPTMEGDTTAFYIHKKLAEFKIKVSSIARGIPVGGDLEYADEITLGRSILSRTIM